MTARTETASRPIRASKEAREYERRISAPAFGEATEVAPFWLLYLPHLMVRFAFSTRCGPDHVERLARRVCGGQDPRPLVSLPVSGVRQTSGGTLLPILAERWVSGVLKFSGRVAFRGAMTSKGVLGESPYDRPPCLECAWCGAKPDTSYRTLHAASVVTLVSRRRTVFCAAGCS